MPNKAGAVKAIGEILRLHRYLIGNNAKLYHEEITEHCTRLVELATMSGGEVPHDERPTILEK